MNHMNEGVTNSKPTSRTGRNKWSQVVCDNLTFSALLQLLADKLFRLPPVEIEMVRTAFAFQYPEQTETCIVIVLQTFLLELVLNLF